MGRWSLAALAAAAVLALGPGARAEQDDDAEKPGEHESASKGERGERSVDNERAGGEKSVRGERSVEHEAPRINAGQPYNGVVLGGDKLPPHPPRMPVKGPQRLTWSGFQLKDGVPTVFLQLTGTPNYDIRDANGKVVVHLKGTVIHVRNNRRPLKLDEFRVPVKTVTSVPRGKNTDVIIETRAPNAPHKEHVEPGANGYQMLIIEFPTT